MNSQLELLNLPEFILKQIIGNLPIQSMLKMRLVSAALNELACDDSLWKARHDVHFSNIPALPAKRDDSSVPKKWIQKFSSLYRTHYELLSPHHKKIFNLVKDGELELLKAEKITYDDLLVKAGHKEYLYKSANRSILNYFFEKIISATFLDDSVYDVKKEDANGFTILHWAIICHQPATLIIDLLKKGADANKLTSEDLSPLIYAVGSGNSETVAVLVKHGQANVNFQNKRGLTALISAFVYEREAIVDYLLSLKETNIKLKSEEFSPLHMAIMAGYVNAVKKLFISSDYDNLVLTMAAATNQLEILKFFIASGKADINGVTDDGEKMQRYTPLTAAAENGAIEVLQYLLYRPEIDVNLVNDGKNGKGMPPIYIAAKYGHDQAVYQLLKMQNLDVNKTYQGQTALSVAAEKGQANVVQRLCADKRTNVNVVDRDGGTPLLTAVFNEQADIVRILLDVPRIQPFLTVDDQLDSLSVAVCIGNSKIVKMLLAKLTVEPNASSILANAYTQALSHKQDEMINLLRTHPITRLATFSIFESNNELGKMTTKMEGGDKPNPSP